MSVNTLGLRTCTGTLAIFSLCTGGCARGHSSIRQTSNHTHTNKQTNKETHTHTHTQTNKQTNKQANKQTSKQFNKFLFSDYFQVLSEFALVNTSFRMKILCITGKVLKSSTMVLMYQCSSKIRASTFVIRAHPTLQVNKIGWRQAE